MTSTVQTLRFKLMPHDMGLDWSHRCEQEIERKYEIVPSVAGLCHSCCLLLQRDQAGCHSSSQKFWLLLHSAAAGQMAARIMGGGIMIPGIPATRSTRPATVTGGSPPEDPTRGSVCAAQSSGQSQNWSQLVHGMNRCDAGWPLKEESAPDSQPGV
ncbi:hypothetical protein NDU88_000302 [Pleurodeles waltl]|uniref:Uncharacterized protein n=1 Tax=Pleurodeles waltl TaxID=8319 RepID=A0AAV7U3L2_PLEWA|nr:hypothetical protein NDU88_000302 [Pleurodeles waltl]